MSIDFTQIEATINSTKNEVTEYDEALVALGGAKQQLTEAQATVASAQEAVTTATEATSQEKADVVAGITAAIGQLNAILTELQS